MDQQFGNPSDTQSQSRTHKGEENMPIETQVNVQDLQRLNDAIMVTMDCLRRVVPQITQLLQLQQPQLPGFAGVHGQPWYATQTMPMSVAFQPGFQPGLQAIDPFAAAYVQQHAQALRQLLAHTPIQTIGSGVANFSSQPYGLWPFVPKSPFIGL